MQCANALVLWGVGVRFLVPPGALLCAVTRSYDPDNPDFAQKRKSGKIGNFDPKKGLFGGGQSLRKWQTQSEEMGLGGRRSPKTLLLTQPFVHGANRSRNPNAAITFS